MHTLYAQVSTKVYSSAALHKHSRGRQHQDRKWGPCLAPPLGLPLAPSRGNWWSLTALLASHFLCFTAGLFHQETKGGGAFRGFRKSQEFQAKLCISEWKTLHWSVLQKSFRDNKGPLGEKIRIVSHK